MLRLAVLALAALTAIAARADAAEMSSSKTWPDKPLRMIVPFPAGSSTDIVSRIIAQKLGVRLGQQVIVDNRSGASGAIGSDAMARAAADGYTIGVATLSTHALAASLNPNLSYNPATDFAPVAMIGSAPYALTVYAGLPAKNVAELIALAKAKPRALNYASAGPASLAHLAGALFAYMAKVELTHVPYRSSGQAVLDLTEGRIEMQFATLAPTLPYIREGKVRALAVTGARRSPSLPEVPTLDEVGLTGYEASLWMALVAPAATPAAIVARLHDAMAAILAAPDTVAALDAQGMETEPSTPEGLRVRIRSEIDKWRTLVAAAGIHAEP
jgi:tripartite-type tricarboxylate transporter receptor subunit TctC